jgi:hypothetical protein
VALQFGVVGIVIQILLAVLVVKRELGQTVDIFDGEKGQIMDMHIRLISNTRKDPQVGVTAVVDEPRRTAHEFAVYF